MLLTFKVGRQTLVLVLWVKERDVILCSVFTVRGRQGSFADVHLLSHSCVVYSEMKRLSAYTSGCILMLSKKVLPVLLLP